LVLDFLKSEFDRVKGSARPHDPDPKLAFEIANDVLAQVRAYSRAFEIRRIEVENDPWFLSYLTDDSEQLVPDDGKWRMFSVAPSRVGYAPVTPEIFRMIGERQNSPEPYLWDQLLLDARNQLPAAGSAIVMASAALESFIGWALDIAERERPLPDALWSWIKKRDDQHWLKEPSTTERFDQLLHLFTGKSLKEDPILWTAFVQIRKARNAVAHGEIPMIGGKQVDSAQAKGLVDATEKIIAWIEQLLPEQHRRARVASEGPTGRRFATLEEAQALGPARLKDGQVGPLAPGQNVLFDFSSKAESTETNDEPKPPSVDDQHEQQ
jgi:hypothetical protein